MRVQLALQVLSLQEQGVEVAGQAVYFTNHRIRRSVVLGDADFEEARRFVRQTRETVEAESAPPPLEDDPRCGRCSHIGVCLPDERALEPVRRVVSWSPIQIPRSCM